MRKFLNLFMIVMIFISGIIAFETKNIYAQDVSMYSGGLVSITYSKPTYSLSSTYYKYAWLTDAWMKASSYKVEKTVTFSSSFTTTAGVDVSIPKDIEVSLKTSISYGNSFSTTSSIGATIPANSNKKSKLRYKIKMKKYKVKYTVTSKYYDTSKGYYTTNQTYERYAIIPQKNTAEIYVYYQS